MMWPLMSPKKNRASVTESKLSSMQLHPDGFSAAASHKTQVSIWFCHAEEMTQLLRSAGYRERRRARVVVMAPSQTMDPEGWIGKETPLHSEKQNETKRNETKQNKTQAHTDAHPHLTTNMDTSPNPLHPNGRLCW